jgi:hypothetical protein
MDSALPLIRVELEGPKLRELASALTSRLPVTRLCLQSSSQGNDALEIVGPSDEVSGGKVVGIARRTGTSISRLYSESCGVAIERREQLAQSASDSVAKVEKLAVSDFDTLKIGLRCQVRWSAQAFASVRGCLLLLAEPSAAATFAELQRPIAGSWTSYEGLVFLATILVPIESVVLCRLMYADSALGGGVDTLARYGVNRRLLVLGRLVNVALLNGALGAISSILVLICASSGWSSPSFGELIQAFWIVGLGGIAYGTIACALSYGKRSRLWPWAFVALDFLLGGSSRAMSMPFPRSHIHNLLGSASAIEFSQRGSCIILGALSLLAAGLTATRTAP